MEIAVSNLENKNDYSSSESSSLPDSEVLFSSFNNSLVLNTLTFDCLFNPLSPDHIPQFNFKDNAICGEISLASFNLLENDFVDMSCIFSSSRETNSSNSSSDNLDLCNNSFRLSSNSLNKRVGTNFLNLLEDNISSFLVS